MAIDRSIPEAARPIAPQVRIIGSGVETRYVEEAVAAVLAGRLPETTETAPVGCLIRSARRRTKR